MFKHIIIQALLLCGTALPLAAQQTTGCNPTGQVITKGEVFFNYGSVTDAYSVRNRTSHSLGEPMIGGGISKNYNSQIGFWSRFLIPPLPPVVRATQGELLDRIQVEWDINPLGSQASDGFKIFRDGVFLASVDRKTRNFNDFNVIAGRPYNYEVRGVNGYGEGSGGKALGFQVPNGVVTGWVRTTNDNPVPDAMVMLTPTRGFSLRFGPDDGAVADTTDTKSPSLLPAADSAWTIAFWVKTQQATAGAGLLQLLPFPLNIRPLNSAGGQEGISVDMGGPALLSASFPAATKNDWHHVALTFNGGQYRLYIDGTLVTLTDAGAISTAIHLNLGARADGTGSWQGKLDELRIYHRALDELDFGEVMTGTASSLTPRLTAYWKMDEEQGDKAFDVIHRNKLYFCGDIAFDADRPEVFTAAVTNEEGYYRIESASYGTGVTFLAQPAKYFYEHRALKFNRVTSYATLPNFALPPKSTIELWVNSGGPAGTQCLLSKKWGTNDFRLLLTPNGTDNNVIVYLNGAQHTFGTLGIRYQHLAFTIDSSGNSRTVTAYKNGVPFGAPFTFNGVTGNWSDTTQTWMLGARPSGPDRIDYFGGLIDEIAVYDSTLSQAKILEHAQNSRQTNEPGLWVYFALDEGNGNRLNNSGILLTGGGTTFNTEWTPQAPNQITTPHEFSPATRQVTLNPSVTSVDQVDFTDRSLIPVEGRVRYANTECFAEGVEIKVNGASFSPPIFTDSTGRFIIDFEPGTTATLTPEFKGKPQDGGHEFTPAFWEVTNLNRPIAGIVFNDVTTRKIKGRIAGGLCLKSIIADSTTDCRVKVATRDGCFEWEQVVADPDGFFEFNPLPPLEVTIAITKHNIKAIYDDFQIQGGRTIDLTERDSTGVNFIYIAPPSVGIAGFENYYSACKDGMGNILPPIPDDDGNPLVIFEEDQAIQLDITVYEQYGVTPGGMSVDEADRCLLDSAILSIDNTFDRNYRFIEPLVDTMRNKKYDYNFFADNPNPDPPYLQIMQVTADVNGRKGTFFRRALIQGIIKGEKKFTSSTPVMPNFVLRDPPGDGSYAYIEKGETICNTLRINNSEGVGTYVDLDDAEGVNTEITNPYLPTAIIKVFDGTREVFESRMIQTSKVSLDYCLTANERISTDDGDLVVGSKTSFDGGETILAGNDVYIGTAFNFIISDAKYLRFNDTTCSINLDVVTAAEPDSFATTFIYSEWNIENNVIRYLDSLIQDGQDPDGKHQLAKERWLDFIKLNEEAKAKARFKRNISWDAGVQYEYAETRDTTNQVEKELAKSFEEKIGDLYVNESGATGAVLIQQSEGGITEGMLSKATGEFTRRGTTVGYVLKDDDPADTWTMDVKDDPLFRTPVFTVVAGQTSCPWEVGTAHREGVKLISVDGNTRLNVPSNEAASFKFLLANRSQTGETFTYALTTGPESNPHGAKIFLNGAPLDHYVYYAIPYEDGPLPVTVTVERGPTEYLYENFELVLLSVCHDLRCNALGFPPDYEPYLYSAVYLTVEFVEPCSEVDISFPLDGWVIKPDPTNPATQDLLNITVTDYDKNDADLLGIRLQYRLENGDGAWINIVPGNPGYIPKAELGDLFTTYNWNTDGTPPLADGTYEIRAVTECSGAPDDNPGISHIIRGRIDREPPSLVGQPQPSDGVYNVGDEISFTFNQHINCDKLNPVDDVLLFDATTDEIIGINYTCFENKIVIDPYFENKFFENRILRAELRDIEDMVGNNSAYFEWEFYVDRNELAWLTDSLGITKYQDEPKTAVANIHNRGGYPVPFTILDAPDWVHVTPNQGTLAPNEIRPVSFTIDPDLAFGHWSDSITLRTVTGQNPFFMGGDEGLPIGVRVVCRPPYGAPNFAQYENTMGMVLKVDIEGEFSTDPEDIVAAFIDDELRGLTHVQYVPQVGQYLAYLTVYGNPADALKPLRLEVWDASACQRYGSVAESFNFQPDNVIGILTNPQLVHTGGLLLREVPIGSGWNWLSFNLAFPDNSLGAALSSLHYPQNDLIRGQTAFSQYSAGNWFGSLTNLNNTTMYIYRADVPDTLRMQGTPVNPLTTNIPLSAGWNWIGYVPDYALPINDALSSLPAQTGDIAKSQYAFAQYINPAFGWVGNLKYMSPPNGYQVKLTLPGTLTYPPPLNPFGGKNPVLARGETDGPPAYWSVDPSQYEHSSTLIGMLHTNNMNVTTSDMELGAFVGDEVRGVGQAIYIEPIDAHLFFLTTYANAAGELLRFKLYNEASGTVQTLSETMFFAPNQHQGSIESPVPFNLQTTGTPSGEMEHLAFEVQPNPFNSETTLRFVLPRAQEVTLTVTDAQGREVLRRPVSAVAGPNTFAWNGRSDTGSWLSSGVYMVRLNTDGGSVSRKVVLQRLP